MDICLNVVSPDEVDEGEDESQFRKIMRQQWIFELAEFRCLEDFLLLFLAQLILGFMPKVPFPLFAYVGDTTISSQLIPQTFEPYVTRPFVFTCVQYVTKIFLLSFVHAIHIFIEHLISARGFPHSLVGKASAFYVGDLGWESSPGGGYGSPLQYSCLENPMDRGTWQATVHVITRVGHDLALSFFLSARYWVKPWGYMWSKQTRPLLSWTLYSVFER